MVGQTISHYRVLEKLGEGCMGEAYLAEDTSLKRKVALNFLPDYLQQEEAAGFWLRCHSTERPRHLLFEGVNDA
jgi:serine/threonine protein kinase